MLAFTQLQNKRFCAEMIPDDPWYRTNTGEIIRGYGATQEEAKTDLLRQLDRLYGRRPAAAGSVSKSDWQ